MDNALKLSIEQMLNEIGLKLVSNIESLGEGLILPTMNDLGYPTYLPKLEMEKEVELKKISKIVYKTNHFRIANCNYFLPSFIDKMQFDDIENLKCVFESARMHFKYETLSLSFHHSSKNALLNLSQSKEFLYLLPKGVQIKSLFLNNEETISKIEKEIANLISNKTIRMDIKKNIYEVPKLILEDYTNNNKKYKNKKNLFNLFKFNI